MTYALAHRVFITLDRPLSKEAMKELDALWAEIEAYEDAIDRGEVPLEEIAPQLEAYTNEIKAIVEADQPGTFPTATLTSTPRRQAHRVARS
jgi:putative peptide zinc metalloprotease protein